MKKKPTLYAVNGVLASLVLPWVLQLSRSGRTTIDWIVVGLVVAAILYNVAQLTRRLYRHAGGWAAWRVQRTVLFWVIGLLNTAFARPEDFGTWRTWVGWVLIAAAVFDTLAILRAEQKLVRGLTGEGS